jgi:hypothetical protein
MQIAFTTEYQPTTRPFLSLESSVGEVTGQDQDSIPEGVKYSSFRQRIQTGQIVGPKRSAI